MYEIEPYNSGRTAAVTESICPTELVGAPVETVWGLLTDPAGWSSFYDLRVTRVEPPGRVLRIEGPDNGNTGFVF